MKVTVLGSGTMGAGIAQACAVAGHEVLLYDVQGPALERARGRIEDSLGRLARKGSLSQEDATAALERISWETDKEGFGETQVLIEAVYEDLEVKRQAWEETAPLVPDDALLATNTSSLSITEIAAMSGREDRFCGMHFFNPVPLMPLVEVVRAVRSSDETIERARSFAEGIGKTPIVCEDKPGFIVNRLLIPYVNDAIHALDEGVASAEEIDTAMKLGANMPIGPLALADLVGLDVCLAAAESLHREFGDPKFRVAPRLRQLVRAGKLGRKNGEGFYTYD